MPSARQLDFDTGFGLVDDPWKPGPCFGNRISLRHLLSVHRHVHDRNRQAGPRGTTTRLVPHSRFISSSKSANVACATEIRRRESSSMNSARLMLAISAPTDWEISPHEYQSRAAATRISLANSVGDKRSADSAPSGMSNVIVGIVQTGRVPCDGYTTDWRPSCLSEKRIRRPAPRRK